MQTTTGAPTILDLFTLEEVERDLYRANTVFDDPFPLYGGQVAGQALAAAGATVPEGRPPHSLHGYYLRGGDSAQPTLFRVDRDRDGRSYSARRVTALQGDRVVSTMSCSFSVEEDGPDAEASGMPDVPDPTTLPAAPMPRLFSMEGSLPPAPYPGSEWPTRFWARCTVDLPEDPLIHACVLTYLSDISTGLAPYHDETSASGSSLDHAIWFHRPIPMDEWVLMDLVPHSVARGRGFYHGMIRTAGGTLGATIAQEALFRARGSSVFHQPRR
ncbi:acyl-CoA thioesterase [Cryptosporangium aurantiacum]|uniref:Acyl-CoA thioesterase-2 n=1 Tax=Cryptosporangium aurantiacum TaxID=134849 RepID=A0A1M7RM08_9ACTN|nr:acyl-CoA thioesterase domain-containing protein [Cryptosporangium aurantiacum]SHN47132.1 acyl-CoA thioesterase-2 [Cryptosporangium aurantiacum]